MKYLDAVVKHPKLISTFIMFVWYGTRLSCTNYDEHFLKTYSTDISKEMVDAGIMQDSQNLFDSPPAEHAELQSSKEHLCRCVPRVRIVGKFCWSSLRCIRPS